MQNYNRYLVLALTLFSVLLASCTHIKTRRELERKDVGEVRPPISKDSTFDDGPYDEPPKDTAIPPEEPFQPPPPRASESNLPKVGLILGPGGSRAVAHAGVIKELLKARIPIDAVVGMEWGALVGALYANKAQIHDVEWRLYKLKEGDLPGKSFFSSEIQPESVDVLNGFLQDGFGSTTAEKAQVSFSCPTLSLKSGTIIWQRRGELKEIVGRCLSYPPLFKPQQGWVAAAFAFDEAVKHLVDQGVGLIIFVDVLDKGDLLSPGREGSQFRSAILWHELRATARDSYSKMGEVITVTTRQYSILDFDKRQQLLKAGEQAGRKAAKKLAGKYGF